MNVVVDTSAVLAVLLDHANRELSARLSRAELHAPHLLDTECLHALRRLVLAGQLSLSRAEEVRLDLRDLRIARYPHDPLSDRVWALRHNLTAYDATFAALAEALEVPMVTCDARLAGAPGIDTAVECYG